MAEWGHSFRPAYFRSVGQGMGWVARFSVRGDGWFQHCVLVSGQLIRTLLGLAARGQSGGADGKLQYVAMQYSSSASQKWEMMRHLV